MYLASIYPASALEIAPSESTYLAPFPRGRFHGLFQVAYKHASRGSRPTRALWARQATFEYAPIIILAIYQKT